MTIELALSGLSMSIFYVIMTFFLIGTLLVIGIALTYIFVKVLSYLIKKMKGGLNELKRESKSFALFENY